MERVTDAELAAWRAFIKAHARIIERIEQDLDAQKRVPLTTYDVLIALFEAPEKKLRFKELTGKIILTKSGITRLVDRLEKEGLIVREKDEQDRRGLYAVLTPAGESELRKAWPVYARGIKNYFASALSEDEVEAIRSAMENIRRGIDEKSTDEAGN
jgi:DNA-binding MarR family transcriptional regulator